MSLRTPRIFNSFINDDLKNILEQAAIKYKAREIHIAPFKRFGFSGANLYLIFFSKNRNESIPYLLKTGAKKEIKDEQKQMEALMNILVDASSFDWFPSKTLAGLLLKHQTSKNIENPVTLKNKILDKDNIQKKIIKYIKLSFDRLKPIYKPEYIEIDIKENYKDYFRDEKNEPAVILNQLTDDGIEDEYIHVGGRKKKLLNPEFIKNRLVAQKWSPISLIHGDLHPDNIVINEEDNPRLIDFKWSKKNDIYLDFALFELSIRYNESNFYLNETQRAVIEGGLLNEAVKYDDIIKELNDVKLTRMVQLIREIRSCCKNLLGKMYKFEDHLFAQFVVLYGLLKYKNYNPYMVIPYLSGLGEKMRKFKFAV